MGALVDNPVDAFSGQVWSPIFGNTPKIGISTYVHLCTIFPEVGSFLPLMVSETRVSGELDPVLGDRDGKIHSK